VGRVAFWLGILGLQLQQSGSPIGYDVIRLANNHLALALEYRCSHLSGRLCMIDAEWQYRLQPRHSYYLLWLLLCRCSLIQRAAIGVSSVFLVIAVLIHANSA
jgi:hypothetical protein